MKVKITCIWLLACCIGCNTIGATFSKDDDASDGANGNTTTNERQLSDEKKTDGANSGKDDAAASNANSNATTNEKQLSDEEKAEIRITFKKSLARLERAKSGCDEYRVLIVNWASFDKEAPDFFMIVNGLTNGGEIWLNSHAADVIDENWKSYGNANYEGTFKTLPALINWVGSYGWRLIEVHDSKLSSINYPEKLYFVKKVDAGKLRDVK